MKLALYLKEYRQKNNLTQKDIADILHVTKQAVSKWENDRGLPDIETAKELSKLLGISLDTLLGNEEEKPQKKKKIIIFSFISALLLIALLTTLIIILLNKQPSSNQEDEIKNELILKTEKELNQPLPKIKEYQYLDFYDWKIAGNFNYPSFMYYFIFEDELIKTDNLWMIELKNDIIDILPFSLGDYPKTCNYFKIIDLLTGEINIINLNDDKPHQYTLYLFSIENKMLTAIIFEI